MSMKKYNGLGAWSDCGPDDRYGEEDEYIHKSMQTWTLFHLAVIFIVTVIMYVPSPF